MWMQDWGEPYCTCWKSQDKLGYLSLTSTLFEIGFLCSLPGLPGSGTVSGSIQSLPPSHLKNLGVIGTAITSGFSGDISGGFGLSPHVM